LTVTLSFIGVVTAILFFTYLINNELTEHNLYIYYIALNGFVISVALIFGSYFVTRFLDSTEKKKYRKMFWRSLCFALPFSFVFLFTLIIIVYFVYTTLPEWTYIIMEPILWISPIALMVYLVYHTLQFVSGFDGSRKPDESFKVYMKRIWRERSEKK
jgi:hypothetical protein